MEYRVEVNGEFKGGFGGSRAKINFSENGVIEWYGSSEIGVLMFDWGEDGQGGRFQFERSFHLGPSGIYSVNVVQEEIFYENLFDKEKGKKGKLVVRRVVEGDNLEIGV